MPNKKMSSAIKDFRLVTTDSQEKVSEIVDCTPVTISNIENGKHKSRYGDIFIKLVHHYNMPVSINDNISAVHIKRFITESKIHHRFDIGNFEVKGLLEEYQESSEPLTDIENQFYFFAKAVYLLNTVDNCDYNLILKMLLRSLKYSLTDDLNKINSYHRNFYALEILIIMNISIVLSKMEKHAESLKLFSILNTKISDENFDAKEYYIIFPTLTYYFAKELTYDKQYDFAIELLNQSIECLIKYGSMYLLKDMFKLLAEVYSKLGNKKEEQKNLKKASLFVYA